MFRSAFLFSVRLILNVTGNYAVSFLRAGFPCVSASLHSGLLLLNLFVSVFPPFALCLPFFALLFALLFVFSLVFFPFVFHVFLFACSFLPSRFGIRLRMRISSGRKREGVSVSVCVFVCVFVFLCFLFVFSFAFRFVYFARFFETV